jgi:anti-sigma B factor antagonist
MPVSILRDGNFLTMWRRKNNTVARDTRKEIEGSEIRVVDENEGLVRIYGCIDIDSSPALRAHLLSILQASPSKVVTIDLSEVTLIDSSGVATLIEALKIGRSYNKEVKLQGLEGRLLRLFQSTGILSLFTEAPDKNDSSGQSGQPGRKAV